MTNQEMGFEQGMVVGRSPLEKKVLVFLKVSGGFGVSIYLLEFTFISRSSAREHGERPVLTVVYRVPRAREAMALETQ